MLGGWQERPRNGWLKYLTKMNQIIIFGNRGRGCSTALEDTPRDLEVMGLNPRGTGLFSSSIVSYFPSPVECPKSGPSRRYFSNCVL